MNKIEILEKLIIRTKNYFNSELGLEVNEDFNIKNVSEIHFLYTSAFVSLSDSFTGTIGISIERPLIVPIAENLMFCEISEDEIDEYAQDCTSEILNIILANTIQTLDVVKKNKGSVSITTPYVIKESTTLSKKKDGTMYFCELIINNSKIILSYFY